MLDGLKSPSSPMNGSCSGCVGTAATSSSGPGDRWRSARGATARRCATGAVIPAPITRTCSHAACRAGVAAWWATSSRCGSGAATANASGPCRGGSRTRPSLSLTRIHSRRRCVAPVRVEPPGEPHPHTRCSSKMRILFASAIVGLIAVPVANAKFTREHPFPASRPVAADRAQLVRAGLHVSPTGRAIDRRSVAGQGLASRRSR